MPVAFSPPYKRNPANKLDTGLSKKRAPAQKKGAVEQKERNLFHFHGPRTASTSWSPASLSTIKRLENWREQSNYRKFSTVGERDGQRRRRRGNNPKSKVWGWIHEMRRGPLLIVWLVLGMSTVFCCCELARCWRPFFFYFFFASEEIF